MKTPNKFLLITVFALVLTLFLTHVYAGDADRIGTAAGVQATIPVGARDLAMGGANLAYTSGLDAIFWNPAGLSSMNSVGGAVFSTMQIFNDINVNYAAVGFTLSGFGTIGLNLKAIDVGDIPLTTNSDPDGLAGQTFSPTMTTAGLTYSRKLTDAIQFGITGKVISESIPRASATAFAFDAGIQYHQLGGLDGVSFGITVKNIGTDMEYTGSGLLTQGSNVSTSPSGGVRSEFVERTATSNQLPANFEIGLGYRRSISEENHVTIAGLFDSQNFANDMFKFGGEYMYSDLMALRGGLLFEQETDSEDQLYRFTLGAGLHYSFGKTDVTFDYAFRDSQYFDGNNMFSIRIAF